MRILALGSGVAVIAVMTAAALRAHDPITTRVSWDREVAPILQARCVSCHAPGGPAPMSLVTYKETRPWARAIREEVLARRMPKWPVVRGYGDFANDPSLSPFEIALLTAWVDGGAPETLPRRGQPQRPVPPPAVASPPSHRGDVRTHVVACGSAALPTGTLLGLTPELDEGGSIEVVVRYADGLEEPLLWLRGFDPAFPNTYWLRKPIAITAGSRARIAGAPADRACRLRMLFED